MASYFRHYAYSVGMLLVKVLQEIIFDRLKQPIISNNIAIVSVTKYARYKALGIFPALRTYVSTVSETMRLTNDAIFSLFYVKVRISGNTCCESKAPLRTYFLEAHHRRQHFYSMVDYRRARIHVFTHLVNPLLHLAH